MDENTTLADLLNLNLHKFEDEVRGIVDKSVKEMGMEKVSKHKIYCKAWYSGKCPVLSYGITIYVFKRAICNGAYLSNVTKVVLSPTVNHYIELVLPH